ncbi:MAG: ATP-binding protein [Spirochaetota bacterium]
MARVLLVEDERLIAIDIKVRLESAGHEVCAIATNAEAAYSELVRHQPDIALMDIRIQGAVDGIEVALRFRQDFDLPIIFLTASSDPESYARAKEARPHGYILKPFQDHAVEIAIEMALERIRLEQDLERQRDLLSAVVDHLERFVLSIDEDDRIVYANEPACELLGGDTGLLGKPLSDVLVLTQEEQAEDGSRRAEMRTSHGAVMQVDVFERAYENRGGKVMVLTDVQKRVDYEHALIQARQQARALNTERAEFLGNIRHELRTPLNSILGMAELALEEAESDAQREYLSILSESTHRLSSLLQSVLDFSKNELDVHADELREVSVRELLEPVIESVKAEAQRKGISVEFLREKACPGSVMVNASPLKQIVSHVLSNAVKFTDAGSVRIRCCMDEASMLDIFVSDTGPGIPEAELTRVFEPFTQLDYTLNRGHGGLGLGLPMARRLSKALGGSVKISSSDADGTTVRITVPVATAPVRSHGSQSVITFVPSGRITESPEEITVVPLRTGVLGRNPVVSSVVDALSSAGHLPVAVEYDSEPFLNEHEYDVLVVVDSTLDDGARDLVSRFQDLNDRNRDRVFMLVDPGNLGHADTESGTVAVSSLAALFEALAINTAHAGEGAIARACGRYTRSTAGGFRQSAQEAFSLGTGVTAAGY